MIGVDTNVLVRVLVSDSPDQTQAALRFLEARTSADPAFVSTVVLIEMVWVLQRSYGYADEAVLAAVESLLDSANVEVEHADMVQTAWNTARDRKADFADCLIGAIAVEAGAEKTVTFDRKAAKRVPGMELLA